VASGLNFIYSTVKATTIEEIITPSSNVQRPFEDRERLNKRRIQVQYYLYSTTFTVLPSQYYLSRL
jgi:hypothetical protein